MNDRYINELRGMWLAPRRGTQVSQKIKELSQDETIARLVELQSFVLRVSHSRRSGRSECRQGIAAQIAGYICISDLGRSITKVRVNAAGAELRGGSPHPT